jgi:energy-coupling factor transport system ATP-binding protein
VDIRAENIGFVYNQGTPLERKALSSVSFALPSGACLGISGGTGAGKTTLIKILNGLFSPSSGALFFDDRKISTYAPELRKKIGLVFQQPERNLFTESVFEEIAFVKLREGTSTKAQIEELVAKTCKILGLDIVRLRNRHPLTLSEGAKRLVAIAAILINEPEVLILDEPAVALSPPAMRTLLNTLAQLKSCPNRTLIIVSHDLEIFLPILDFLLVIGNEGAGRFGPIEDLCEQAGHDPDIADYVPELARLVFELRKHGALIPEGLYDPEVIAAAMTDLRN